MGATYAARALAAAALASACGSSLEVAPPGTPPAALQIVSGDGQAGPVGLELPNPLVTRVIDAAGHPIRGQIVNFRLVAGGGSVFAGAALTNDSGFARERWTLGTSTTDSQRVEARAVDNTTGAPLVFATFKATALPGPVASAAKNAGDGQTTLAGATLPDSLAVSARDKYGNPVPGATVAWAVNTGGGSITPPTSVTNAGGIARAAWTLGSQTGAQEAKATVSGVTGAVTFSALAAVPLATVDGGFVHTCAVGTSGAAYCWGEGSYGRLGTGTTNSSVTPARVAGTGGWTAISAGVGHSCAVTTGRVAYCWGWNGNLALGTGDTLEHDSPTAVASVVGFQSVSAGQGHTCGLSTTGEAYCWGLGAQLGNGSGSSSAVPMKVVGGNVFRTLSAGDDHTCAVTTADDVYCWGANFSGQLGDGTATDRATPVLVSGGLKVRAVSGGTQFTCAITLQDQAYCWGRNDRGQLGNASTTSSATPVPVAGTLKFQALSLGNRFSCGLTTGGAGYCWGENVWGELGNGTTNNSTTPAAVSGGLVFQSITAGYQHACGVTTAQLTYCWGLGQDGQLGDGTNQNRSTPVRVLNPT